jgi:hypothetical protein
MIRGTITPVLIPKKFLFWKFNSPNFNRMSCVCEHGKSYWLERNENEIRCLDQQQEAIASCGLNDRLFQKLYSHKQLDLPIRGSTEPAKLSLERAQAFIEIAGNKQVLPGSVPGQNRNAFCSYEMSMNFSKVDFQCFDDRHFASVSLGIYLTILQLVHRNINPT